MKKIILTFIVLIIAAITLFNLMFKEDPAENKVGVEQRLVKLIEKKRQTNNSVIVDFKEIAPFDWDKVYIFTPYTPAKWLEEEHGFKWNHSEVRKIEIRDDIDLIVFVKNDQVIGYVRHARSNGIYAS